MSVTEEQTCPLCLEEMDATDKRFQPCPCGYQLCVLCFHQILDISEKDRTEAKCPACRALYDRDKLLNLQPEDLPTAPIPRKSNERQKQIDQREENDRPISQSAAMPSHIQGSSAISQQQPGPSFHSQQPTISHSSNATSYHVPSGHPTANGTIPSRKHLVNVRVIQRNLVYVTGIPLAIAREDILRRQEYFGRYGKIVKVAINRNNSYSNSAYGPSASAYVTFERSECAQECIRSIDGLGLEGRTLKACFGTTKYCNAFLKNVPCNNPDCLYLHDVGSDQDSYTKEQMLHKNGKNGLDFHDATHATTLKNEALGVSASGEGSYEHRGMWNLAQSISQDREDSGQSADEAVNSLHGATDSSSSEAHPQVALVPSREQIVAEGPDKKRQSSLGNGHPSNGRNLHQYGQLDSLRPPMNSFHGHHENLEYQSQNQGLSRMFGMSQTQANQYSNGNYAHAPKQFVQPPQVNNAVGNILLDSVNRSEAQSQSHPQSQSQTQPQSQSQYGYYDPWASFVPPVLQSDQSNRHFSSAQPQGAKNAAAHSRFAFARNGDADAPSEGQLFGFPRSNQIASSFYSESDDVFQKPVSSPRSRPVAPPGFSSVVGGPSGYSGQLSSTSDVRSSRPALISSMATSDVDRRDDENSANVSTNIPAAIPPSLRSLSSHVSTTPSSAADNIERLRKNMSASDQELEEQRSALERMGLRGPKPTATHQEEGQQHFPPGFLKGFQSFQNGSGFLQQLLQRDLSDESERKGQDLDDRYSGYGNADTGLRNKDVYHLPNAAYEYQQAQGSTSARYNFSNTIGVPVTESDGSRHSLFPGNGIGLVSLGSERSISGEYMNSIDRESSEGRKLGKKVPRRRRA